MRACSAGGRPVAASLDDEGIPSCDIVEPAAWDFIEMRAGLREHAARAAAIVFGSLAQRDPVTRSPSSGSARWTSRRCST